MMAAVRLAAVLVCALTIAHVATPAAGAALRAWPPAQAVLEESGTRLAAGNSHTCQIADDGTIRCWGGNGFGQIGDGTTTNRPLPVTVLTNAVAIAAGGLHTCALLASGGVRCWGFNSDGQLGVGDRAARLAPTPVNGIVNAVAITAGRGHTCALLADGGMRCWGAAADGQLGDGGSADQLTPVAVPLANVVAIDAGGAHTCALLANSVVAGGPRCWGDDSSGQLGDDIGLLQDRPLPVQVIGVSGGTPSGIAAGGSHTCALIPDGTAMCWGKGGSGQLGDGGTSDRFAPGLAVSGLSRGVAVQAGGSHTCALLAGGGVRCWGRNSDGQLGDGTTTDRPLPVAVSDLVNAVAVAAGGRHTCAVLADGSAFCWGDNEFGQLGNGTTSDSATPTPVAVTPGSVTGRDVTAGGGHTCAARANGTVSCWGDNGFGQLGDGTTTPRLAPAAVGGSANAVAVAAGGEHTCSLRADATVSCWGRNEDGQLGDGTTTTRGEPVPVGLPAEAIAVAAGGAHSCAILAAGTPLCWGRNDNGQVGDGTTTRRRTPVSTGETDTVAIAAGTAHTCAVRAVERRVLCWGDNSRGQVGDGTTIDRLLPTPVGNLVNAVAIAAGTLHTCALLADGTVRCWGANDAGQLGDGTRTQRTVPLTVIGLTNVVGIAVGDAHSCAFRADGTVACWGDNSRGQLGDGTTTSRLTPTTVTVRVFMRTFDGGTFTTLPLANIVQVATGRRHTCVVIVNGGVRCWGENAFGQLGIDSTTDQLRPAIVPSFTLNIVPLVRVRANGRVATVEIIATCEPGQRLHVEVTVIQGDVAGRGVGTGECTGAITRYPVTVPAQGSDPFAEGPALVHAQAEIRDGGLVVDTQEWTRRVEIASAQ